MSSAVYAWPVIALGEVLTQYTEYIDTPEPRLYPKLSVKLYGKGVILDTPTDGSMLKMQRHQIAKAGQMILSEIWGKKGAIGLVPAEGEGALCTSHFFLFDVHRDKLDSRWLQAIFTANYLQDQLDSEARGTTGYAAVRPRNLLAATIPLPPLDVQRRIVAHIEALAMRIAEAQRLRRAAVEETHSLARGVIDEALIGSDAEEATVDFMALSVTDGDHQPPPKAELGIPFILISNITTGKLDLTGSKWVPQDYFYNLAPSRMPAIGDVLYAAVGASMEQRAL